MVDLVRVIAFGLALLTASYAYKNGYHIITFIAAIICVITFIKDMTCAGYMDEEELELYEDPEDEAAS